tara:strand:+ start:660 stop:833 length:174 start_codon:yes stop_codon:yes gene_type:complete
MATHQAMMRQDAVRQPLNPPAFSSYMNLLAQKEASINNLYNSNLQPKMKYVVNSLIP